MNWESILHGAAAPGTTDLTDAVIFFALGAVVALVIWLMRVAIRFLRGPAPIPQEAQDFPYPIIVHLSLGDRLRARQGVDEDIEAITRQIEEQN